MTESEPAGGKPPQMPLDFEQIRADLAEIGDVNFCPEYLHSAIRHVQRNCEIECYTPGHEDGAVSCVQPGRYDGTAMARLLAAVPALLALATSDGAPGTVDQ